MCATIDSLISIHMPDLPNPTPTTAQYPHPTSYPTPTAQYPSTFMVASTQVQSYALSLRFIFTFVM